MTSGNRMGKPEYFLWHDDPERPMIVANCQSFIGRLPSSKNWRISIQRASHKRTKKQRNSLFGVAYKAIMEATGLEGEKEKQQLHTHFCGDFFGWAQGPLGQSRPFRTTTIDQDGNEDEIDRATAIRMYEFIQRTAAEYGVDVPDPDPTLAEDYRP